MMHQFIGDVYCDESLWENAEGSTVLIKINHLAHTHWPPVTNAVLSQ